MDSDYVAWNGERYVWPPPDGWYLASDGRWWAPDTGPEMDLDSLATESGLADGGAAYRSDSIDDVEAVADASTVPDTTHAGPTTAYKTGLGEPSPSRPVSGQVVAVSHVDPTTATAAETGDSHRNPTMVMAEPPRAVTGPHPEVAPDPDTGRHDQVSIVEPVDEASTAGIRRSRTMTMVAAGLLAAAAIGIAALLALLNGDNETQTQQPSASADEAEGGVDELVVSTDESPTPTSADGAMEDVATDDAAMDDAMSDEGDAATSTTLVDTGEGTENAAMIGQFRTLLEENQITAAALTGDDLVVFGQTACSYASAAGDLTDYEQIRDEALSGAQNEELSSEELRFVVDAAVTVFCAEDATRLGLTATAPAAAG